MTTPTRARVERPRLPPLPPRAKLLRPKGTGSIAREADGYRARGPAPDCVHLGLFADRAAAEAALERELRPTVNQWIETFLASREAMRLRSVKDDRNRLETHVTPDVLGRTRLAAVDVGKARAWLQRMMAKRAGAPRHVRRVVERPISPRTVGFVLTLVRGAFQYAVDGGRLDSNPFRELRVPRASRASARGDYEGVLDQEEQTVMLLHVDRVDAPGVMLRVALGLGLRRGETLSLRWEDVDVLASEPALTLRWGSHGGPTKGGRPRRIPVFGVALEALVAWRLRAGRDPRGLVFPSRAGRGKKLPMREFRGALAAAGITRRVRWHDLRHTCGTSLLMGWWGRKWSVPEVQRLLGHRNASTTERYLHARNELIFQAASAMRSRDAKETPATVEFSRLLDGESDAPGKHGVPAA